MLLSLSTRVEQILNKFNSEDKDKILDFFNNYKKGMWIYPGVMKRKTGISIKEAYNILNELEKENILDSYYELYCGNCQRSTGIIIKVISEMPDIFQCEICHNEMPSLENAVMIFKAIKG